MAALTIAHSGSAAENSFVGCAEVRDKASSKLLGRCEVRLLEALQIARITAQAADRDVDATFVSNASLTPPTAVTLLLDQSMGLEVPEFTRVKSVVAGVLDIDANFLSFGLYTFSNGLKTIAPLGTAPNTTKLALAAVQRSRTGPNELLRSISVLLPTLKAVVTERKILVILSDGRFDDSAYSVAEIVSQLKEAKITVFSIAPGRRPVDLSDAQALRRLAVDTSGEFFTAADAREVDGDVRALKSYLTQGGFVTFPILAKETALKAVFSGDKTIETVFRSDLYSGAEPQSAPAPAATPAPPLTDRETFWASLLAAWQEFLGWAGESWIHQVAIGAAILVMGILAWMGLRSVAKAHDLGTPESNPTVADLRPTLARFEFLDGNASTELVCADATRIGRHKDNDIVLKNTSVHRHHAILKHDSNGPFVIVDMNTENGVLVNGARVVSARLNDGDVVELGEVRMRFRLP